MSTPLPLADRLNRPIGVLRLSLTARCNLACPYCCPDVEEPPGLLTLEQQMRVIRVASRLGAQTLRLTGGEPLLSRRLLPLLEAVAHDGQRLQPLLAVIPSGPPFRSFLDQQLQRGELRWMDWLSRVPHQTVLLPEEALVNANYPADLAALEG